MGKEYIRDVKIRSASDWTKDIPLWDYFKNTLLKWTARTLSTGTVARDTSEAHRGEASVKLVTAAAINDWSDMAINAGNVKPDPIEVQIWFKAETNIANIELRLDMTFSEEDANTVHYPGLKINIPATRIPTVYYYAPGFAEIDTGFTSAALVADVWYKITLKMHLGTREYISLQIGNRFVDLTGKKWEAADEFAVAQSRQVYRVTALEAAVKTVYLDDIYIDYSRYID